MCIQYVNVPKDCLARHEAYRNANEPAAFNRDTDTTDGAMPRGGIKLREILPKSRQIDGAGKVHDPKVRHVSY
jgi:hypothetical protein